ncbi:MAG: hypothetical protein JST54_24055 [Deltaproteobacteria bacterium]|nr:hypothetical protein [Deltaproteobacteria bacterium]
MNPAPAQEKKSNGCLIALIIVGGLMLLVVGAAAVGLVIFARSDTGKKIVSVASKGGKVLSKGMNAPGTPELVKLGCAQAMVFDPNDFSDIVSELVDGGMPKGGERMVICQVRPGAGAPTCDDVAKTYVAAVGPGPEPFMVTAGTKNQNPSACQAEYDGSGALLRTLPPPGSHAGSG